MGAPGCGHPLPTPAPQPTYVVQQWGRSAASISGGSGATLVLTPGSVGGISWYCVQANPLFSSTCASSVLSTWYSSNTPGGFTVGFGPNPTVGNEPSFEDITVGANTAPGCITSALTSLSMERRSPAPWPSQYKSCPATRLSAGLGALNAAISNQANFMFQTQFSSLTAASPCTPGAAESGVRLDPALALGPSINC